MDPVTRERLRKLAFVPVLALGVVALLVLKATRAEPERVELSETGKRVRALTVAPLTVIPRAVGYGVVEAREEWQMVAEVSGRVVEMHEQLKEGEFVTAGTTLIKIDPGDYEIAEAKVTANLEGVKAQIKELQVKEESARANLKIEQRSLDLAKKELARVEKLTSSGVTTQADVDREERNVLAQEKVVQSLKNTLQELPANRRVLEAQIKQQKAGLATASRDIARTELVAPYDVRIREVRTSLQEVVGGGQVLAVADSLDRAEIPAQFSIGVLRPLLPFRPGTTPLSTEALSRLPELIGLKAIVRLEATDLRAEWEAAFDRFTSVDPQTRTIGVVVAIDKPYQSGRPGERPPVATGMYMEVELRGAAREGCLAVPRGALHGDVLHVVDKDRRLARREVQIAYRQAEFACLAGGIEPGEQVVLTDVVPAIEGMLLDPVEDEEAAAELRATASEGSATK
ncbi:MAG: biotin/lipoyl-binding protein [Myxococcales bacterium]|nr:biotin/lipoyl-binding protein [Myxococcales bacterium]